jgi:hypothetical protein
MARQQVGAPVAAIVPTKTEVPVARQAAMRSEAAYTTEIMPI